MESSKPIPKTLDRLFPKLEKYPPFDQEKAVDPLIGLMRVKENTPKYLMSDGQLIGLNLANTGLTDAHWQEIMKAPDFDPGHLQALNLSGNRLTAFSLEKMVSLKLLDLSENGDLKRISFPSEGGLERLDANECVFGFVGNTFRVDAQLQRLNVRDGKPRPV